MQFFIRVNLHETIATRWYGCAWHDFARAQVILCPVPFNWIIGLARRCWMRIRRGPVVNDGARRSKVFREGVEVGRDQVTGCPEAYGLMRIPDSRKESP